MLILFQLSCLMAQPEGLPTVDHAISVEADHIRVAAGRYLAAGTPVSIAEDALLAVPPAEDAWVEGEPLRLPAGEPSGYWKGAMLAGPRTVGINAPGSFVEESLVVFDATDGKELRKGTDYQVSAPFALLALGNESDLAPDTLVHASYRYHLQRIDSVVCDASGRVRLVGGKAAVAEPLPPDIGADDVRLANVHRPYGATSLLPEHVYPVIESAALVSTNTTPGRIPRTLAKLEAGEAVTIVCLGDSITAGGDASTPERSYVAVFEASLRERFPEAELRVLNISMGGTRSAQWLNNGSYPGLPTRPAEECSLDRVVAEEPDLVTIEFVNDITLPPESLPGIYMDMVGRLRAVRAEVILVAPGFCAPGLMGATTLTQTDTRPYVPLIAFLRQFAEQQNLAFADVASRWDHLRLEGLPFMTLLRNEYNHPGDRGHALYAEELTACFEPS